MFIDCVQSVQHCGVGLFQPTAMWVEFVFGRGRGGAGSKAWNQVSMIAPVKKFGRVILL